MKAVVGLIPVGGKKGKKKKINKFRARFRDFSHGFQPAETCVKICVARKAEARYISFLFEK